jgi:hypothetical protein
VKRLHAATVITQAGRVVGVQVDVLRPAGTNGPAARLVAGPGQLAHRIELRVPAKLATAQQIERFHTAVGAKIGVTAGPPHSTVSSSMASARGTRKRPTPA